MANKQQKSGVLENLSAEQKKALFQELLNTEEVQQELQQGQDPQQKKDPIAEHAESEGISYTEAQRQLLMDNVKIKIDGDYTIIKINHTLNYGKTYNERKEQYSKYDQRASSMGFQDIYDQQNNYLGKLSVMFLAPQEK